MPKAKDELDPAEHWLIVTNFVKELGYNRREWDFSRPPVCISIPKEGLIKKLVDEVAMALDGTCFGVSGLYDLTQKPHHPGPKSEIPQDQKIYAEVSLYRATFMLDRGLVIQDDFAKVQAYGTIPKDVRLKGYVNIKHHMTDPSSPVWQLIEKIDKIRIQV